MGINILRYDGGLGNQMFQYAFYLSAKKRVGGIWLMDARSCRGHHNGFELDDLFNLGLSQKCFWGQKIRTLILLSSFEEPLKQELRGSYYDELDFSHLCGLTATYSGYWQSEKYFEDVAPIVKKAFGFPFERMSALTLALAERLRGMNTVAIHVRRGDYLREPERATCTPSYYKKSIEFITEKYQDIVPVVFSDDIPWCRSNFAQLNAIFVDWNTGKDSWQDMYLMSICKHNIIANSSFSWWGAWLNENPLKCVICPQKWNVDTPIDSDRCPKTWIRIF